MLAERCLSGSLGFLLLAHMRVRKAVYLNVLKDITWTIFSLISLTGISLLVSVLSFKSFSVYFLLVNSKPVDGIY